MSKSDPSVSVVMPVYNGARYLRPAIESILTQSLNDLELIVVDDGSTDAGPAIVQSFADSRIKLLKNNGNLGIVASLNRGLDEARGKYIARMDCDDISLSHRLERQLRFMDGHPQVGISGAWAKTLGSRIDYVLGFEPDDDHLRAGLVFFNPMIHPTLIMNRELINGSKLRYRPDFHGAEDYDLLVRGSANFRLANICEVLLRYRTHAASLIHQSIDKKLESDQKIRVSLLEQFDLPKDMLEIAKHESNTSTGQEQRIKVSLVEKWLGAVLDANRGKRLYDQSSLELAVYRHWLKTCNANANLGLWMWRIFRNSPLRLAEGDRKERRRLLKCFFQCLAGRHVPFS